MPPAVPRFPSALLINLKFFLLDKMRKHDYDKSNLNRKKGNEKEEYMKNPEREDGSPAERPSREVVMEGSF